MTLFYEAHTFFPLWQFYEDGSNAKLDQANEMEYELQKVREVKEGRRGVGE